MIRKVKVQNFKSLENVSVDLDDVTVLIGRSGSGKTNFVDAIRFLRDLLVHRNAGFVENVQDGWVRIFYALAPRPTTMSIEVVFDVFGRQGNFGYLVGFKTNPSNPNLAILAEEKLTYQGNTLFHAKGNKWVSPPNIINPPEPTTLMLGSMSGIQDAAIAYVSLTNGLGCYDFPHTVMQSGNQARHGKIGLMDGGQNYLEAFEGIETNLQALDNWYEIIAALRILNPSIKSIETRKPDRTRIVVSHDVGGKALNLDLDQESEGVRRFLMHLIALYQSPPKQTLVFEEPEKGIHPGALSVLAEQFLACPNGHRGQIILTTHSPELLNKFSAEQLRVVDIKHSSTTIGMIATEQVQALKEKLMFPGELLTVDQARLATQESA